MQHRIYLIQFKQRGVAAVEFALIAPLFFAVLFGVIEMGRVLFYMNAATEATRLGARVAVVCDIGDPAVVSRMQSILPQLTDTNVSVVYLDKDGNTGCSQADCETVRVSISQEDSFIVNTFIPYLPFSVTLPTFSSTLPRESLSSAGNVLCD